jgi:hypothetical protein
MLWTSYRSVPSCTAVPTQPSSPRALPITAYWIQTCDERQANRYLATSLDQLESTSAGDRSRARSNGWSEFYGHLTARGWGGGFLPR